MLTNGGIGIDGREQDRLDSELKSDIVSIYEVGFSSIFSRCNLYEKQLATKLLKSCRLLRLQPQAILKSGFMIF